MASDARLRSFVAGDGQVLGDATLARRRRRWRWLWALGWRRGRGLHRRGGRLVTIIVIIVRDGHGGVIAIADEGKIERRRRRVGLHALCTAARLLDIPSRITGNDGRCCGDKEQVAQHHDRSTGKRHREELATHPGTSFDGWVLRL